MTTQRDHNWVNAASPEERNRAYEAGELTDYMNAENKAIYGDGSQRPLEPSEPSTAVKELGPATAIPAGQSPASQLAGLLASIDATVADPDARAVMKRAASSLTNYGALSKPEEVTGPTWDSK